MTLDTLVGQLINWALLLVAAGLVLALVIFLVYVLILWYRWKDREKKSLEMITLLVAVPEDNEVKIDAMEQIVSSFSSIYKSAKFKFLQGIQAQDSISMEIVGTSDDIKFYISLPKDYQDFIEKQVYSVYAGADIQIVEEPNIYTEGGKVEYAWLGLKKNAYYPVKTYKEMPTDPLASVSSALSKLNPEEAVSIQLIVSPTDGKWAKAGNSFISSTKKSESNPEKASYKVDAKQLEAIQNKCNKAGFEVALRIVSVAPSKELAKMNLSNIKACFSQYESPWNKLSGRKIKFKNLFMEDFIYKYPVVFWSGQRNILSAEEVASVYHFPNKAVETPNIYWLKSKKAALPVDSPQEGMYIGDN